MTISEFEQLLSNATDASNLLKVMSNPHRLMILCILIDDEMTVSTLNDVIPLSQSALSQHLAALRKAELVSTRRESQQIFYRVNGESATEIIKTLKRLFC